VERRTSAGTRPVPTPKEIDMLPQLIEWGPAHLREEASSPELEQSERPDDN
jgi:hypothetical protein